MKFIPLLIIIICTSSGVYAQKEFHNKTIAIPPRFDANIEAKSNVTPVYNPFAPPVIPPLEINAPTVFDLNPKQSNTIKIGESNLPNMSSKEGFANPGDMYQSKVNKGGYKGGDGGDYTQFKKNQYFGEYKTTSDHVRLMYRDFGAIDGDLIKIYVNGKAIKTDIFLLHDFQGFDFPLDLGFNKFEIEALNQGSSGPNTAEYRVYDDEGILVPSKEWNLATGFKASFIIIREEK